MDPKAKTNILVEELAEETLVYDLDSHRAHSLNPTAAFLLHTADGTRSEEELARRATAHFGEPASLEVARLGLDRLRGAGLMEWGGSDPAQEGMTRRQAVRKVATVGILLPAVMTIVTPTPAQAATAIPTNQCNLANVGRCCTNSKTCVQVRGSSYQCRGPKC
jgi:hypothetical protein